MSKTLHIKVATPCQEDWQKMLPEAQGRHCQNCAKSVIDFSQKSDAEIISFFKNKPKNVCGRFTQEQLNRAYPIPTYSKSIHYGKIAALLAGLSLSNLNCQDNFGTAEKNGLAQIFSLSPTPVTYTGRIVSESLYPVIGAKITVNGSSQIIYSNIDGRFEVSIPKENAVLNLHVESEFFKPKSVQIDLKDRDFVIEMQPLPVEISSESSDSSTEEIAEASSESSGITSEDIAKISRHILNCSRNKDSFNMVLGDIDYNFQGDSIRELIKKAKKY